MVEIELGNVGSEEQAKRIQTALQGKSYFNFQVSFSSCVNNWPVIVWTEYEGYEERVDEVKQMIMFLLACAV